MWIGADPGGAGKFGVAVLDSDGSATTALVDCTDEAFAYVLEHIREESPQAVGIDAPLWWSSGRSGSRSADLRLKNQYPNRASSVQAINSLWGSVLIQGVLFAHLLRARFPKIGLTEAHPKLVLAAAGRDYWQRILEGLTSNVTLDDPKDDRRDALIAAVAAREGSCGAWPEDLFRDLPPSEANPSASWLGPIHYYWPERLHAC